MGFAGLAGPRLRLHRRIEATGTPLVLAIGNFDGVHLGHQALLAQAREVAHRMNAVPAVLTFSPSPRAFFATSSADVPARLSSTTEKLAAFARADVRHAFVPRFNAAFAAQTPHAFMHSLAAANVVAVVVGADFRFGFRREGDVTFMRSFGGAHGVAVHVVEAVEAEGRRISSSSIRDALARGELPLAAAMLGRPVAVIGRVTHGKKLGRTLGYPTANVALSGRKPALGGVFAVKCRLVATRGLEGVAGDVGDTFTGVANLGTNPVVSSENRQHLEVFLFDVPNEASDLYGKRLEVIFIEKIRDELKLPGLDALVAQMRDDELKARTILSRNDDGNHGRHPGSKA